VFCLFQYILLLIRNTILSIHRWWNNVILLVCWTRCEILIVILIISHWTTDWRYLIALIKWLPAKIRLLLESRLGYNIALINWDITLDILLYWFFNRWWSLKRSSKLCDFFYCIAHKVLKIFLFFIWAVIKVKDKIFVVPFFIYWGLFRILFEIV
jgi:hypothetical protein